MSFFFRSFLSSKYFFIKRFCDIFLVLILLPFSIPLFLFLCLLITIDLREFPIFIQKRHGFKCKTFTIFKLKTMRSQPVGLHLDDHRRITPFTYFIRQLRLDELPQIICILFGNMSFVGPRPLPPQYTSISSNKLFPSRYSVPPGIMGLAQLYGGELLPFNHRLKIDLIYVSNCSFRLDLFILKKTILLFVFKFIFSPRSISKSNSLPHFS